MRTSLNIDDDLMKITRLMDVRRNVSLGSIVLDLIRTGLRREAAYRLDDGLPVFEVEVVARTVTLDDVYSADDHE